MSTRALNWAFAVPELSSSCKFVLVAMADAADDDGQCWPSAAAIGGKTNLNRKTVFAALSDLETGGYIARARARKGVNGRIQVWVVNPLRWPVFDRTENGTIGRGDRTGNGLIDSTENGTIGDGSIVPKTGH